MILRFLKKRTLVSALGFAVLGVFAFGGSAWGITSWADAIGGVAFGPVTAVLGIILAIWSSFAGFILFLLTKALLFVSSWNYFVQSQAVTQGWSIIRDICNMAFVLILLAIAIGTILQQEKYHYSKLLLPLISSAIIINFSKTICGLIIDAAQVVMLTFVSAYESAAGGNMFVLLGAANFWNADPGIAVKALFEGKQHLSEAVISTLLTMIMVALVVTIADVVIFVMIMILIARVVMLWFLIVLSPFAFALTVLPSTQSYAQRWWKDFGNHVVVGPAMAFFLWLSFATIQGVAKEAEKTTGKVVSSEDYSKTLSKAVAGNKEFDLNAKGEKSPIDVGKGKEKGGTGAPDVGLTTIGSLDGIINYMLGIGMLLGTLMIAQELGVAGGKMAGAAAGGIKDALSGKSGPLAWQLAMKSGWGAVTERTEKPWKEAGARAGVLAGQLADKGVYAARQSKLAKAAGRFATWGGTKGDWVKGTKLDQARTLERFEHTDEETATRDLKTFQMAEGMDNWSGERLTTEAKAEKNKLRKAALTDMLNKKGLLRDEDLVKHHAEEIEHIGGSHMLFAFDDQLKKTQLQAAFEGGRFKDEHGNNAAKFTSDAQQGKFNPEKITEKINQALNAERFGDRVNELESAIADAVEKGDEKTVGDLQSQLTQFIKGRQQEGVQSWAQDFYQGTKDGKEITNFTSGLQSNTKRDIERYLTPLKGATAEQKVALAKTGLVDSAFDLSDKKDEALFMKELLDKTEFRDLVNKKASAKTRESADFQRIMSSNNDYKMIKSVGMEISRDAEMKAAENRGLRQLILDANKRGDRSIETQRLKNRWIRINRSSMIEDENGNNVSVYDLEGSQYDKKAMAEKHGSEAGAVSHMEQEFLKEMAQEAGFKTVDQYRQYAEDNKGSEFATKFAHDELHAREKALKYHGGSHADRGKVNEDHMKNQIAHERWDVDELENQAAGSFSGRLRRVITMGASSEKLRGLIGNNRTAAVEAVNALPEIRGQLAVELAADIADVDARAESLGKNAVDQLKADLMERYQNDIEGLFRYNVRAHSDNHFAVGGFKLEKKVDDPKAEAQKLASALGKQLNVVQPQEIEVEVEYEDDGLMVKPPPIKVQGYTDQKEVEVPVTVRSKVTGEQKTIKVMGKNLNYQEPPAALGSAAGADDDESGEE